MPIREYLTPTGSIIEVIDGDGTVLPRGSKRLMSCGSFSTGSVREENMSDKVKAGYYKKECDTGSQFKSRFSKKQIKAAWGW